MPEASPAEWLRTLFGKQVCSDVVLVLAPSAGVPVSLSGHRCVLAAYPGLRARLALGNKEVKLDDWPADSVIEVRTAGDNRDGKDERQQNRTGVVYIC